MKLGFIRLGKMATGIVHNFRAGHKLTVYNRTRAKAEDFASEALAWLVDRRLHPAPSLRNCGEGMRSVVESSALLDLARGFHALTHSAEPVPASRARIPWPQHHPRFRRLLLAAGEYFSRRKVQQDPLRADSGKVAA